MLLARLLTWRSLIFSAKCFAGGLLALYIAFSLGLQNPYWAMTTVYIVSQPFAGMVRSKALYRTCGTIVGAAFTVVALPNLVDQPLLCSLAFSLWMAVCLYLSLIDRTPRAYASMLAGYTAAIIGFASVGAPQAIFTVALARAEEIILGIGCGFLVHDLVLPQRAGPILRQRVETWFGDAARWARDALLGRVDASEVDTRMRLAAEAAELDALRVHAAFDTPELRVAAGWIARLQADMRMLFPVLSGVADRYDVLSREHPAMLAPLRPVLEEVAAWIGGARADPDALQARLARLRPAGHDWYDVLARSLLERAGDLIRLWQDCQASRAEIRAGHRARVRPADVPPLRDHAMVLRSALATGGTTMLLCVVWIATAWPDGGIAASQAAVLMSFYATQDDPFPSMLDFVMGAVIGTGLGALVLFALLPAAGGFVPLALALGAIYLPLGVLMRVPQTARLAIPAAIVTVSEIALQGSYSGDFAGFFEGGLALCLGYVAAAVITRLVRSVGADVAVRRLLRASRAEIARVAADAAHEHVAADAAHEHVAADAAHDPAVAGTPIERAGVLASHALQNLAELAPRMAALDEPDAARARRLPMHLRTGLNLLELRAALPALSPAGDHAARDLLAELVRFLRGDPAAAPDAALRERIDATWAALVPLPEAGPALLAVAGLRRALYPAAPAPASPPEVTEQAA